MSTSFELQILSPAGLAAQETVAEVVLPAWNGEVGVLPEHVPYTALLGTGVLRFAGSPGATSDSLVVSEGFCVFENATLKVLADRVFAPEDFVAEHGSAGAAREYSRRRCGELETQMATLSVDSHEWKDAHQELLTLQSLEQCITQ